MKHTKHLKRTNKKTIKNIHTRKRGGKCGCGAEGCPIAPFAINGGKMNTRRRRRQHRCVRGGQALPVPPPLVGAPWTAEPNTWPGYGAPTNHGNHFSQNMYYQDPQMMIQMEGGQRRSSRCRCGCPYRRCRCGCPCRKCTLRRRRRMGRSRNKRSRGKRNYGGATFFQNAVNAVRDVEYNVASTYNALRGYEPPMNPLPYKDQLQPRQ